MTTDAERREATDQWTIQLREQRMQELTETLNRRNAKITELEQHLALVERYGADQWQRGNAGREPQEWDEWRQEYARA